MFNAQAANRWGAEPGFAQRLGHWSWCREALPMLLLQGCSADRLGNPPTIDMAALARAFWAWAATLDHHAPLERLDPVDYAHFQVGMLLANLLRQAPLQIVDAPRDEPVRVLTDAALTLLAAWRQALGAEPLKAVLPDGARWASYVENVGEDPVVAVAFLDVFTGRAPMWSVPSIPSERAAMRRALEQQRTAG